MRGSALLASSLLFERLVTLLRLVLGQAAFLVLLSTHAGLDRALFNKLAEGSWIDAHDNLILCGPTGIQISVDKWHELIGDPTYADAILDRVVHNAHRINLAGDSLRRTRAGKASKE